MIQPNSNASVPDDRKTGLPADFSPHAQSSMRILSTLAETAKANTSVMDALPHLAGMLMVMVTLSLLWGVCVITAKLVKALIPEPKPPVANVAKPATHDGVEPEVIAVIAAAVTTIAGPKCRIISVKPTSNSWEKAGRQSVFTSHRIN